MPVPHPTYLGLKRIFAALLACSLALSVLPASAAPESTSTDTAAEGAPFVTLDKGAVAVPLDGAFAFSTDIVIDRPTTYLEARLQIHNPSGRLLFQKTEIRNNVATSTVTVDFGRELADLELAPGAYPVQLRVRSDAAGQIREWVVEDKLLLYDPNADPVTVALAVHVSATPGYNTEGRFVVDPAQSDTARAQVDELAGYVLDRPGVRLTLALPPLIAEEWARIAAGYETSGPEGVVAVEADSAVPKRYAATLTHLKAALDTGRLELVTVPYADPDVAGLTQTGRIADLTSQFERGFSATLAGLETSSSTGLATSSGVVPASALPLLDARGFSYALVSQTSVTSDETTPVSGTYALVSADSSSSVVALVGDDVLTEQLRSASATGVVDAVFARSVSDDAGSPIVATVDVGPGRTFTAESLATCLDDLVAAPWVEFVTGEEAATRSDLTRTIQLAPDEAFASDAPNGYWAEVSGARELSSAFLGAVGVNDPDAQYASDASMVAQSSAWAGPDGTWSSADRGLGFAAAANRTAATVLDGIRLAAQDIALSSAQGEVPITIANASEKNLLLTLRVTANGIALPGGGEQTLTARPQDNYVTIPVDLQSSLSGGLSIQVWAGTVLLDSIDVTVRATFLDRLVLVGSIAVALVGLLLFIRHRTRTSASVGTIDRERERR